MYVRHMQSSGIHKLKAAWEQQHVTASWLPVNTEQSAGKYDCGLEEESEQQITTSSAQ